MKVSLTRRHFVTQGLLGAGAAATGLLGLATGCRRQANESPRSQEPPPRPSRKLAMQAAWVNDAEFTGYFVALTKNWYRDEGLDLEYLPGGPDVIPEATLLSGRAQIALTTPDTTVNLILKERAPLRIIGAQYQKSPLGIVSLAKAPIKAPADLIGKTLAVPPVNVLSVEALLKLNDVPRDRVTVVPYLYDPAPLVRGEVDATVDFTTNVPYTIKLAGVEPHSFLMYDFGFTIYNDTVVVTEETLRNRRADVIGWLRASRRGWEENLRDPSVYPPQFAETYFRGNGRAIDNEVFFNRQQAPLIKTEAGILGMTEEGIQANIRALRAIGLEGTTGMFVTDLVKEL